MQFQEMGLIPELLRAVDALGYTHPTPIQQAAIPTVLRGQDLLGLAQTGTGKTAAFALPILQRLAERPAHGREGRRDIAALVLTPTRELAIQIADNFRGYGAHLRLRTVVIFGGVGVEPQRQALRAGVDILIATPGRLLDLMGQGDVSLGRLQIFVLDEADRMLDMGFVHDVKRVIKALPRQRQTLFFSATMPREAKELADELLTNAKTVAVTPVSSTVEAITQEVHFVPDRASKRAALIDVLRAPDVRKVLVFARTKHGANRLAELLDKAGIPAAAIHGNKSQGARERAMEGFRRGTLPVLVATDIAARGIDVDDVTHVVNFDLPEVPETYVHRIGRTARAGRDGHAVALCEPDDRPLLKAVERLIGKTIPVASGVALRTAPVPEAPRPPLPPRRHGGRPGGGGGGRSSGPGSARDARPEPRRAAPQQPSQPRPPSNEAGGDAPRRRRRRRGARGGVAGAGPRTGPVA